VPVKTTWNLTHACVHCGEHDLSAKRPSERAGYARWLAAKDCAECWKATRDRQAARERDGWLAERRAAVLAGIEAWEVFADMPVLEGSDKATGWARHVRYQLLAAAHGTLDLSDDEFAARIEAPARRLDSVSWWIDQRDTEPIELEKLVGDAGAGGLSLVSENPY